MNASTIAIHWHDDSQPVYSVTFQHRTDDISRLASAGGDNNIRIWKVSYPKPENTLPPTVEYLSTLRKHTQAVNVVRFSPRGDVLASAGDDGLLILWTKSDKIVADFGHQDDDAKESWVPRHILNMLLEVYDLSWSPDAAFLAAGSMDNTTRIFSASGNRLCELTDHSHYVQGVAWDPQNEYLATQSADRTLQLYRWENGEMVPLAKHCRVELPTAKLSVAGKELDTAHPSEPSLGRRTYLFHLEALQSFFRRLAFSPDGALLVAPLGVFREEPDLLETAYVFVRSGLARGPVCHLPGLNKPSVAVAFSPVRYKSRNGAVFALPYKMVFAVATQTSVVVYDTEQLQPLGVQADMHYLSITDLCWHPDGQSLVVSSAEGFCLVIVFDAGVFGEVYGGNLEKGDGGLEGDGNLVKRDGKLEKADETLERENEREARIAEDNAKGVVLTTAEYNEVTCDGGKPEERATVATGAEDAKDSLHDTQKLDPESVPAMDPESVPAMDPTSTNSDRAENVPTAMDPTSTNSDMVESGSTAVLADQATAAQILQSLPFLQPTQTEANSQVSALLSQFIAPPVAADQNKKRRVQPTLIQPEKNDGNK